MGWNRIDNWIHSVPNYPYFYSTDIIRDCIDAAEQNEIHRITESQNHRIVGVGRDLCGSSSPIPLPKQGQLQQAAQDPVQAGLEYLQRFPSLPFEKFQ